MPSRDCMKGLRFSSEACPVRSMVCQTPSRQETLPPLTSRQTTAPVGTRTTKSTSPYGRLPQAANPSEWRTTQSSVAGSHRSRLNTLFSAELTVEASNSGGIILAIDQLRVSPPELEVSLSHRRRLASPRLQSLVPSSMSSTLTIQTLPKPRSSCISRSSGASISLGSASRSSSVSLKPARMCRLLIWRLAEHTSELQSLRHLL